MSLIEAKSVVLEVMQYMELPESSYWKVWSKLVNVYRDVNLHHSPVVKISKEVMNNNKVIFYPDDMIDLIDCYVPYNGEMAPLTPKKIIPTQSLTMGIEHRDIEDGEGEQIRVSGRGYSAKPSNPHGYYNDYKDGRYIVFLTENRSEVILAYKTSGLSADNTLIPAEYKNALLWGTIYQETLMSKTTQWRTQEVKQEYDNALSLIRKPKFNVNAFLDAWLNGATLHRT